MPKINMSAIFDSSRIVIVDSYVLSSVTSASMETTAIMDLSILKSKSRSIRKPSHDDCLHCMAWSSISDLVFNALLSCRVSGEHIRWLKADICVCDRHDLWRSAPFRCGKSLKGEIVRSSEEISPIIETTC
jgi:hypothetical protein